ncbi:MAG: hypothetical protein WBW04_04045 [Nitrolancea sp.]
MSEDQEQAAPDLYIWLHGDPRVSEPDTQIEDLPGVSDLKLLATAIASGRLGRYLPNRVATSPHRSPGPTGFRSVDVSRLMRDYQIPHRRCYEVVLEQIAPAIDDETE